MLKGGKKSSSQQSKRQLLFSYFLSLIIFLLILNLIFNLLDQKIIDPYLIISLLVAISSILFISFNSKKNQKTKKVKKSNPKVTDSMKTLINNLDSGIIELDKNGGITLYNASCLMILNTNKTLYDLNIAEVMPLQNQKGEPIDIKNKILNSKRISTNDAWFYQTKDGEKIRLELTISPIKNNFGVNEKNSFILIFRDVTKIKDLEQQKDEFISIISHELRTPIAIAEGALSNLDLLLERKRIEKDKFKKLLDKSHRQIMFLSSMVTDISNLRRAESEQIIDIEKVNLRTVANELYETYLPQVQAKNLSFDLDLQGKLGNIETNQLYFKEIIQNLITNAIKYTNEGSIKLIIEKNNLNTKVSIKDSGIGISKSDQKKVFDKFYRSEDYRTRESRGTGLGLYVALGLAKKLGGKITLKSRVDFGSTFTLTIPNKPKKIQK